LTPVPAPFPAVLAVARVASAQALVAFRGNRYSVPPELARAQVPGSPRAGARVAAAQALGAFRGNRDSVPPELARAQVTVTHRLGAPHVELATSSGIIIARHQLAPAGAGAPGRGTGHG